MNELLKKLNYKKGTVQILNAPAEFKPFIEAWKAECEVIARLSAESPADFLMLFASSAAEAARLTASVSSAVGPATVFWVAYPKQTSRRYKADINRDTLWPILESFGYRPNRQVAVDEDWSALRFARN
jgi:hypothetical protein